MIEILIDFFAYFLIWIAVLYDRKGLNKIEMFTKRWFVIMALIIIAGVILKNNN